MSDRIEDLVDFDEQPDGSVRIVPKIVRKFYMLACLPCGGLPIPFDSQAERGGWAAGHTAGTGHDTWRVWTDTR